MEIINHPLVEIALRTAVIYAVVLTGLRLMGKREVALAVLEVDGMISVLKNDEMPKIEEPHHRMRVVAKEKK